MASAKMTMLLDLSNKLFKSKFSQTNKFYNSNVVKMQKKFSNFTNRMHSNFSKKIDMMRVKNRELLNEIPGVNRAFELIKNPYVAATAGGLAFIAMAKKGVQATEKFNTAFLPIKQLNLDKSSKELELYRNQIRDAAFEIGADLKTSTNAIYDLQSATGLYGKEAIEIYKKVGKYSFATGANLNDAMNSTTKAMKAFGLGVKDIDKLLESNAKTVQTGITTFNELAKVQTEYAGAAAMAGQGIDVANKTFAVFTSIAKNSDVGANMTKSFFDGLRQNASKIEKELQISVFDDTGKMRKADKILKDIANRFDGMNDKQITSIITKIGGPDGLQAALGKAAKGADDLRKTLKAFDNSEFTLSDAISNAAGDFTKQKQIFFNRLEITMTKFGEKIIPALASAFDKLTPALNFLYKNFDNIVTVLKIMVPALVGLLVVRKVSTAFRALGIATHLLTAKQWLLNIAMNANPIGLIVMGITALVAVITIAIRKYDEFGSALLFILGPIGALISSIVQIRRHWDSIVEAFSVDGFIGGIKRLGQVLFDIILSPLDSILSYTAELTGWDWVQDYSNDVKEFRKKLELTEAEKGNPKENQNGENQKFFSWQVDAHKNKTDDDEPTYNRPRANLSAGISSVTGTASQSKNITINIDAFHKGEVVINDENQKGLTLQEVEDYLKETLMRVTRSIEMSQ